MASEGIAPGDGFVELDGAVPAYRIADHERLAPFLSTVVSAWNHWLFVSSTGGLTAGRESPDLALFPYETDDRLHYAAGTSGPVTLFRVTQSDGTTVLWEPFRGRCDAQIRRHIAKSLTGDALEFEEVNTSLGLTFRYRWSTSARFGFVRRCALERHEGHAPLDVAVLDGLVNLMPPLVELGLQQGASCLVDAYKLAERGESSLAYYSLAARIVDRAEASEALLGTVAWSEGLEPRAIALSDLAIDTFRRGEPVQATRRTEGRRFAYLVSSTLRLETGARSLWHVVADVGRTPTEIVALERLLQESTSAGGLRGAIEDSVREGSERLRRLVASADGVHATGDAMVDAHHYANVLFNIMRGGVFFDGHRVFRDDLARFIAERNLETHARHASTLASLDATLTFGRLVALARETQDPAFLRLVLEYLPLTFSRRHGDPSRPWNRFRIRMGEDDARPNLGYEGNWRDIFQNWEALLVSFPGFIDAVIAKFVNASTVDGYNAYRIAREGIDWEVPEPREPWSNIGYWGDHQTIYLLKLLEWSQRFRPESLDALLDVRVFSYADVPYRIAPYEELLVDPHRTIRFDRERDQRIRERVARVGADGRLLHDEGGSVVHVTLVEKLLVSVLARLSNLVPDAGIWMNTQRPEWNDANNALVGNGLSMVTLCYVRRFVGFAHALFAPRVGRSFSLSTEVATWLGRVQAVLGEGHSLLQRPIIDDVDRKRVLDGLGGAYSDYRARVYEGGLGVAVTCPYADALEFLESARDWLDHAIRANRRPDGLYHAYNLLALSEDGARASVEHLYEMLEGQVAVLSSGALSAKESLEVVDALFDSAMYRADQRSFTLYPARRVRGLLERGVLTDAEVASNGLLMAQLDESGGPIVVRGVDGRVRFRPDLHNAEALSAALDRMATDSGQASRVEAYRQATLALYESTFRHREHTGRSGTMFAYEGVGSIYWHMVAKLLLAIQEVALRTEPAAERTRLVEAYRRVRSGLSAHKTALEYGAFPFDPYSHTPAHRGAQQPGMTGQVKEEILCRFGELGVRVDEGCVHFDAPLFDAIPDEGLSFTLFGVPVVVRSGSLTAVRVHRATGDVQRFEGGRLDPATSAELFAREGDIVRVEVALVSH